ncbi:MAG: hypothetical protein AMXMBFR13_09280 [Phycisphaerae bacterium]
MRSWTKTLQLAGPPVLGLALFILFTETLGYEPGEFLVATIASLAAMLLLMFLASWWARFRWTRDRKTTRRAPAHSDPLLVGLGSVSLVGLIYAAITGILGVHASDELIVIVVTSLVAPTAVGLVYLVVHLFGAWLPRSSTARIVVGQVNTVMRQKLPLATGIALAAESENHAAALHLQRIARLLAQGASLPDAMRDGWADCPSLVLSLVAAGERAGQLPAALEQAENYLLDQESRRNGVGVSVWPYAITVLTCTVLLVSGIGIAIIPKFKEIFNDYEVILPAMTTGLVDVLGFFGGYGGLFVAIAVVLVPAAIYLQLRPRRIENPSLTTLAADWLRWRTPGIGRLQAGEGMALALGTMRLALRSGLDLATAASLAAELDINAELRRRFSRFMDLLSAGEHPQEAAQRARLGSVTVLALGAGQRDGDMDAALRYAVDYHQALLSRLWIAFRSLSWPLVTLALACLVAVIVLALFLPLVHLINASTGV